ncbi:MAG: patatin-like phospholipase family protein, partial [Gemmatimonadaceae bacterium]
WPTEVHWDGGVTDYHLDLEPPAGDGLVLYPHFYPHVVPGWFDKALPWRRAHGPQLARTLLIAPSDRFVASLPGGKIPDRRDFASLSHTVREQRWQAVRERTTELGDELRALITSGDIAAHVEPFPDSA